MKIKLGKFRNTYWTGVIAFCLVVVFCVSCFGGIFQCNIEKSFQLTAEQLDFIETLQQSYSILGESAVLEENNERYAVLQITRKNGDVKRHLFDLETQTVAVSNYVGHLRKSSHFVAYADEYNNNEYVIYQPTSYEINEENHEFYYANIIQDQSISAMTDNFFEHTYKYDSVGNIKEYGYGEHSYLLTYDLKDQITSFSIDNQITEIFYDNYGNIIKNGQNSYKYDVGAKTDILIEYNGLPIKYDSFGNPTNYLGKQLIWSGRQLLQFEDIRYTYDRSGIRNSQTINDVTTYYFNEGKKVIFEKTGDDIIYYYYKDSNIIGFNYNGKDFYYAKNAQNDIIGIFTSSGELIVEYLYDPWGKILEVSGDEANSIGIINPYRYRSYRYDNATQLYYLGSRYYNPEIGRFMNADDIINLSYTILGDDLTKNLFTYCNNNPFNMIDPNGTMSVKVLNVLKTIYSDLKILPDSWISTPALVMNGANIYNGFHETAQLVAAKRLSYNGYITALEYKTMAGEADILAFKGVNYLYEVKPYGYSVSETQAQLTRYINATGFLRGPSFAEYSIDFLPRIRMYVNCSGNGIINYSFYNEYSYKILWSTVAVKKAVEESRVKKYMEIGFWVGVAVAGTIIVATLAEDIITAGAGIVDDVPSIGVAASAFRTAITAGLLLI